MYHRNKEIDSNFNNYYLKKVQNSHLEDEVFSLQTTPKITQQPLGFYLVKIKGDDVPTLSDEAFDESLEANHNLENELERDRGFWVDKPNYNADLVFKMSEYFNVDVSGRNLKTRPQIFVRPKYFELAYLKEYRRRKYESGRRFEKTDLSSSDDKLTCHPDPDLKSVNFKKIPTGCQCDWYAEHKKPLQVWDTWYTDKLDMLRQHELNKVFAPFKTQLAMENYHKYPPVKLKPGRNAGRRTFPMYQ